MRPGLPLEKTTFCCWVILLAHSHCRLPLTSKTAKLHFKLAGPEGILEWILKCYTLSQLEDLSKTGPKTD